MKNAILVIIPLVCVMTLLLDMIASHEYLRLVASVGLILVMLGFLGIERIWRATERWRFDRAGRRKK